MRQQLSIGNDFPKKSLGQNFITDNNFILKLNEHIITSKEDIIIEIGPGKGALTKCLSKKNFKDLYLIEKDNKLASYLTEIYKHDNKIKVINEDALKYNYRKFKNKKGKIVICGNLPFNISTKLLILWLSNDKWPSFFDRMILMFQKEVADRIIANHSNKKYGRLSVLVQSRCKVNKILTAPSSIFFPKPKVDGMIIQFEPIDDYKKLNFTKLENLLEKSFNNRRKKIKNTLKEYKQFISQLQIDENLRPENLSVADYCNLVKLIN